MSVWPVARLIFFLLYILRLRKYHSEYPCWTYCERDFSQDTQSVTWSPWAPILSGGVVHDDTSGLWGFMSVQRQYLITPEKCVYFPFSFPRYKGKWPQFILKKLWKKFLVYSMAELYSMLEHWSEGSRSRNREEVMHFPGIIWGRFVPPHFFFFLPVYLKQHLSRRPTDFISNGTKTN